MACEHARIARTVGAAAAVVICATAAWGQATLPEGWSSEGELATDGAWLVARNAATIAAPIEDATVTRLLLRPGALEAPATCRVEGADGVALELRMQALDGEYRVNIIGQERIPLPDACVELRVPDPAGGRLFNQRYFIRPFPHWYEGDERQALLDRYADLPPASQHPLGLRIDARDGRVGLWVDDRYVAGLPMTGPLNLRLALSPGNAVAEIATARAVPDRYVPVGLRGYRRPGSWRPVSLPTGRGAVRIEDVPFDLGAPGDDIDVGLSRWLAESRGPEGFTENYFTRSAFDSRPEDVLLAIPTDEYSHAHLLCAVDPDPAKTPVISLRLTRLLEDLYDSGGRGDAFADTSIRPRRAHRRPLAGWLHAGRRGRGRDRPRPDDAAAAARRGAAQLRAHPGRARRAGHLLPPLDAAPRP